MYMVIRSNRSCLVSKLCIAYSVEFTFGNISSNIWNMYIVFLENDSECGNY